GYLPYYLLHEMHPVLFFGLAKATFLIDGFHHNMFFTRVMWAVAYMLGRYNFFIFFMLQCK
ncbi:uncharacterized protein PHACADRAFT_96794, partial [Phanerochaete carnosa HHB-10118-sp]